MDVQSWNNGARAFHPSRVRDRLSNNCNCWCSGSEHFLTPWQGNHFSRGTCKHSGCFSALTEARRGALKHFWNIQEEHLPIPLANPAPVLPPAPALSNPRGSCSSKPKFTVELPTRIFFCSFPPCTLNLLWGRFSSAFGVALLDGLAAIVVELSSGFGGSGREETKDAGLGRRNLCLCIFFSPCLWSRNICWEPRAAELSNTPAHCQATLLSSGALTAQGINQAIKNGENLGKKCQKPNLSRIKWIRTLLVFSGANWKMFLTPVSPLCHCCLRNFVITKLLWAWDT